MMPKLVKPGAMDERTLKNTESARFFWQTLRGIVVIVALWGFIAFLTVDLYGGELGMTAFTIFALAMVAMRVMFVERGTLGTVEVERTLNAKQHGLPEWSLLAYGVFFSLGCNWECVFLWFSRRYDPFSAPVVGTTVVIMALYAAIGIVVARLTTRNWRTALVVFAFVPGALAGSALRLGFLR